jgi:hypothetical protein
MRQKFRQESLYAVFGHAPTQIPMILQRDRLNDSADQIGDHSRPRDRHVRSIQPFPGSLLQATPGQRRVGSLVNVFGESLFDTRIKLAQSPLLNGPTLVFESGLPASVQRTQCRYVGGWSHELATQVAQHRNRHVLKRPQCGTCHPNEA